MKGNSGFLHRMIVLVVAGVCSFFNVSAQNDSIHEVTLYVMPTLYPLNWDSPSALYKSMNECYVKTIGVSDNYLLGHMAVQLTTPLLAQPKLIAQRSGSMKEKLDLIFKQKVGFGIIGAALQGRLETDAEINHQLKAYQKRNKLAMLRYRISEGAMKRILAFINQYSSKVNGLYSPSEFYGGAFWPRYYNEGSGCSAFGMSLLELINLMPKQPEEWREDVKIPIELIGGEYNQGKKVKSRMIKRTKEWYKGQGKMNVDYVKYVVYDPSVMFNWIMAKRTENRTDFSSFDDNGVPGLYVDARNVVFDERAPLFVPREEPNLFIDKYYVKTGMTPQL
jgi:hypothetical protein